MRRSALSGSSNHQPAVNDQFPMRGNQIKSPGFISPVIEKYLQFRIAGDHQILFQNLLIRRFKWKNPDFIHAFLDQPVILVC